ncbi:uncharacterized protein EDB91DRAFT_711683 [Suillus paluster]|uniref:uncharacterized protein n=1 Tax=Suillus paluster TaxID=48578 RepID=UPI001B85B8D9|nr:uncharacterized protein EDB91DRAFT_711683 [Suillus paluster]KAG1731593.1 hypothetical protein EDB91DRAFT_711683 [Suillus paluster]
MRKLKAEVVAAPEVDMVMVVMIKEHHDYRSLASFSEAWELLHRERISRQHFVSATAASHTPNEVSVASHTWCLIESVRLRVCVRGEGPIHIDTDNSELILDGLAPAIRAAAYDRYAAWYSKHHPKHHQPHTAAATGPATGVPAHRTTVIDPPAVALQTRGRVQASQAAAAGPAFRTWHHTGAT